MRHLTVRNHGIRSGIHTTSIVGGRILRYLTVLNRGIRVGIHTAAIITHVVLDNTMVYLSFPIQTNATSRTSGVSVLYGETIPDSRSGK